MFVSEKVSQHSFKKPSCYIVIFFQASVILQTDNKQHQYLCDLGAPVCPGSAMLSW